MKSTIWFSVIYCLSQLILIEAAYSQVRPPAGRIALSSDGNAHDRDDIGASALALAMLAKAGLQHKLVHYGYNSHIWFDGKPGQSLAVRLDQKKDMTKSVMEGARRFGFNTNDFFSVRDNADRAYDHLASEINRSTANNPLYILVGGPYHHVCTAIHRSRQNVRQYVTVINHGDSNPTHRHDGSCTAAQTRQLGVKYVDILNQNDHGFKGSYGPWQWLKSHSDADLRWVYSRMIEAFAYKADVSDAGMVWYFITGGPRNKGDQKGNPKKLRNFFD